MFARSSKLLGLAAGLAAKEISGRVERAFSGAEELQKKLARVKTQLDQARQIVESLGRLKGAAMKAGQMLSLELRDYLPPEVIEILSQLQSSGQSVPFEEIESILRAELGPEKFAALKDLSREPLASASIGQVHTAKVVLGGQEKSIVLKVQFRGIADTIDSDIAMVEKLARTLVSVALRKIEFEGVFDEIREVLKQETDYLHEARSLKRYRGLAAEVDGLVIPEVLDEFTTSKVLALTHEAGVTPDAWMKSDPSPELRAHYARVILEMYFREFLEWGFVQTDPNFGNFLIRPDTRELVCLDFGATKEYTTVFRRRYRDLVVDVRAGRDDRAMANALHLGLIDPRESESSQRLLLQQIRGILSVFDPENQPFDFTDRSFVDETRDQLLELVRTLKHSAPPKQLLFLHRKLAGVYALVKALGVKVDLRPYWTRLETADFADAGAASEAAR